MKKKDFLKTFSICNPDVSSKDPKLPPWFRDLHNQKHMSSVLDNNVGTSITDIPSWYILVSVFGDEYNPFAAKMILKLFLQVRCHFWLISTISDFRNNNRVNDIAFHLTRYLWVRIFNSITRHIDLFIYKLKHALHCSVE